MRSGWYADALNFRRAGDDRARHLIAALPPAWSGCQCVFQMSVMRQPFGFGLAHDLIGRIGRIDGGSRAARRLVNEAVIVRQARELMDLKHV